MKEELTVGDHNSIIVFGNEVQSDIRNVSKTISKMLLDDNYDLELIVNELVYKIEKFENKIGKKQCFFQIRIRNRNVIEEYKEILLFINDITLNLQKKEAQLLKNNSILEHMDKILIEGKGYLEEKINQGNQCIIELEEENLENDKELLDWRDRLYNKIEELKVSKILISQTQLQMMLMKENNYKLIDRIVSAITITIPLWRNQISIILGTEEYTRNSDVQDNIDKLVLESFNNKYNIKDIDIGKINEINSSFTTKLFELAEMDKQDTSIKNKIKELLL